MPLTQGKTATWITNFLSNPSQLDPAFAGLSGNISASTNKLATQPIKEGTGTTRNPPAEAINKKLGKAKILQFPSDRPKYFTEIKLSQYSRQNLHAVGRLDVNNRIYLPLPLNLIDQHQIAYDEQQLGLVGAAIDAFGALSKEAVAAGIAADAAKAAASLALGTGGQGVGLSESISGALTGARVEGYTPNEYVTILLKSPKYKRHTLKWKFSADEFQESVSLRKIFWVLNNSIAPGLFLGGSIFTFPAILEIGYWPNSGYLYKFKPAVCEALVLNFSGGGAPAFYRDPQGKDGGDELAKSIFQAGDDKFTAIGTNNAPESVEVEMHLIELEYWISGDFKDTNNPWDGHASHRVGNYWGDGT
jgi:hypothetical protein